MNHAQLTHYNRLSSYTARASYLVTIHLASDFSEACSMVSRGINRMLGQGQPVAPRPAPKRPAPTDEEIRRANRYADLD